MSSVLCLLVLEVLQRRHHSNSFIPSTSLTQIYLNVMVQIEVLKKKNLETSWERMRRQKNKNQITMKHQPRPRRSVPSQGV